MQWRRQHAAARRWVGGPKCEAAQLIGLEKLDVAHVIDSCTAGIGGDCLCAGALNAEIEWLLAVGSIPRGHVPTYQQRKIICPKPFLHERKVNSFFGEDLRFNVG